MKKVLFFIVISLLLIPVIRANEDNISLAPNAKSAIIVEESTGKILYERNSHEKLNPASMTNIMTT